MNNGGEKRWNVIIIHETFKIYQQMGQTPHESRYDTLFRGPTIHYGAEIFHQKISTKDKNRLHQFSSKVLKGIFRKNLERGRRLDKRSSRGRCRRIERQQCIRSLRQKIQRKRTEKPTKRRTIHVSLYQRFNNISRRRSKSPHLHPESFSFDSG